MSDDHEPYTLCPYCQEKVDPNGVGVLYAVKRHEIPTMGRVAREFVDGAGGFFHPGCPPSAVGYVQRERPGSDPAEA